MNCTVKENTQVHKWQSLNVQISTNEETIAKIKYVIRTRRLHQSQSLLLESLLHDGRYSSQEDLMLQCTNLSKEGKNLKCHSHSTHAGDISRVFILSV